MHIFHSVKSLIAFDLVDLVARVKIELVFAQHRDGGDFRKGENERSAFGFYLVAIAKERERGVLVEDLFVLVENDLGEANGVDIRGSFVVRREVEAVDKYLKGCTTPKEREDFLLKACEYYSRFLQRQRNKDRDAR